MPLINFSGLASGIDSDSLIKATSDATRKTRVTPLQDDITELQTQDDAFTEIKNRLAGLQSALKDVTTLAGGPLQKNAQTSDETVMTASALNSATDGTYSLTVTQLACNATQSFGKEPAHYTSSSEKIAPTIDMGAPSDPDRTIKIEIGAGSDKQTVNVEVTDTTTLSDFVTSFNNQCTSALATVINIGTTSAPDYRIVVTSNNTGTQKGTMVTTVGSAVSDAGAFNIPGGATPAQDAQFTIGGIAGTITRSTNTVTDVIPGVTFNLKGTGGPASCTVSGDVAATTEKIQGLVDALNKVIQYVNENNTITRQESGNSITNVFGSLAKTSLDDNVITSLRSALTGSAYSGGSAIKIFADLGITTDSGSYDSEQKTGGGTLKFNATTFKSALAKEPISVAKIVQTFADTTSLTGGTIDQYIRFGGMIDTTINSNKEQITDLNSRISDAEAAISKTEEDMRRRFATLESTISRMQSQQQSLTSALAGLK